MAPPTVLVADDEPLLLDLVAKLLERAGLSAVCVAHGDAVLETFRAAAGSIEVLVLDRGLPPHGAVPVAREILTLADVGIVLTGGNPADPEAQELLAETGGQFLLKPFPPRRLLELIETVRIARGG